MSGGSGNGVDVAAVYHAVVQVAQTMNGLVGTVNGLASTVNSLSATMKEVVQTVNEHTIKLRKLDSLEEMVVSLRETLTQYHSSVVGHGILITDLEHRVRRIEDHLHLPPVM